MATLKRFLGEAGAGLDEAHGFDTLYDVMVALVTQVNDLTTQFNILLTEFDAGWDAFNTLKGEYDAETNASHVDSAADDVADTEATAVTAGVSIES